MSVNNHQKRELPPVRLYDRYTAYRDLCITYEGRSEEIPLRVPDLSTHGIFINTQLHFAEGSVLKLRFRLTRTGYEVHARGEVRYCLEGVGLGVEFIDISPEAQGAIEDELQLSASDVEVRQ